MAGCNKLLINFLHRLHNTSQIHGVVKSGWLQSWFSSASSIHTWIYSALAERDKSGQHGISRIFISHKKNQTVIIKMYVIVIVLLNTNDSSRKLRGYLWGLWSFKHFELTWLPPLAQGIWQPRPFSQKTCCRAWSCRSSCKYTNLSWIYASFVSWMGSYVSLWWCHHNRNYCRCKWQMPNPPKIVQLKHWQVINCNHCFQQWWLRSCIKIIHCIYH